MNDLPPELRPLEQQLYRRLELRIGPIKAIFLAIQNEFGSKGLGHSGALIRALLEAFQTEVELRINIVESMLRSYRQSCSSTLLVSSEKQICVFLDRLIAQHCQYVRYECEQIANPVLRVLDNLGERMKQECERRFNEVTQTSCALIISIAKEIVMASQLDLDATKLEERPNYVYNNTIQGSVGALAQGHSTIGHVSQTNNSGMPVSEIIGLIRLAVADWSPDEQRQVTGAIAMLEAGAQTKSPDEELTRAAISKIGKMAMSVGQSVATQALVGYLKCHGWITD